MAKRKQADVDELVIQLADAVTEFFGPNVTRVTVDPQPSGEYPYQVHTTDEQLPHSGLATGEPAKASQAAFSTSVAGDERKAGA